MRRPTNQNCWRCLPLPWQGLGLSIEVGTGRFAAPLGLQVGIDPVPEMLTYTVKRGVTVVQGVAEALPFANSSFDYLLCVTTTCFVDDAAATLAEAKRVLKPSGEVVIGFIDRSSELGRHYRAHQAENVFYREATFFSVAEVEQLLRDRLHQSVRSGCRHSRRAWKRSAKSTPCTQVEGVGLSWWSRQAVLSPCCELKLLAALR